MNNLIKISFIAALLILMSCSLGMSKNKYIKNYDEFVKDVSVSCEKYSNKQWHKADSIYTVYSSDFYEKFKSDLTTEERNKVNKLTGEYIALRAVSVGKGILSDIEDLGIQMESMIETVLNELQIDSVKN